jgi:gliding motility-associated-like protein
MKVSMRFTVVLILIFLQHLLSAQPFIKVLSSDIASAEFTTIDKYPDGGWVCAGIGRDDTRFYSFVSRFDNSANLLWSIEPQYYRDMRAVVSLDNGDILVFNNNSGLNQYFDASVLHLDDAGNFVKEIVWGTPDDQDDWFDARKMPDGSVIAVGMSRLSNDIVQRVLLARFSDTGQLLWEKMFDANEFLAYPEVVPLPSGGFLILGGTYVHTDRGILIARFSGNGDLLWSKEYARPGESHYVQDGIPVGNDEIMVATYRALDFSINSETSLLRINLDGEINGQTLVSNASGLAPIGIGMIGPDTLALAGMTTPIVFPPTDGDLVIATLTKTGNLTGNIAFGSDYQEFGTDVIFGDDEAVFCGSTDTSVTGIARQPFISRANPRYSCCRKSFQVFQLPVDNPLAASDYPLTVAQNTVKQNIAITTSDILFTEKVTCRSYEETDILPADTSICTGEILELKPEVDVPGTPLWNTGENSPAIHVSSPGVYSVIINSECGVVTDTIEIRSRGVIPDVSVSPDTAVCKGADALLSASGGTSYLWQDETGAVLSDNSDLTITPDNTTVYRVAVSIGDCSDTAQVSVSVLAPPVVYAGPDLLTPEGVPVALGATGAESYQWQPPTGLTCTDCPNPVATNNETVTYIVTGYDAEGCSDTASVTVTVKKPCPFYIPNIFAPGNSTENSFFRVYGAEIRPEGYLLRIYSRWGELVFQSNDAAEPWDGLADGQPAQPGVYTWQLEMNTCDGLVRKSGDITLVR